MEIPREGRMKPNGEEIILKGGGKEEGRMDGQNNIQL